MTIEALPANQPETFYRGAGRIAEFRNGPALPDRPEDWVGSTTSRFALAPVRHAPGQLGGTVRVEIHRHHDPIGT